jgi:hypothetical protein
VRLPREHPGGSREIAFACTGRGGGSKGAYADRSLANNAAYEDNLDR